MKIAAIRLDRMRLALNPPFNASRDQVPRRHFDATLVRVETDEGVTGYGSDDTMDGFEAFAGVGGGRYLEFPYDPPGWTPQPVTIEADRTVGAEIDEDAAARWALTSNH